VLLAENKEWLSEERSVTCTAREEDTTARGDRCTKRYGARVLMVGRCLRKRRVEKEGRSRVVKWAGQSLIKEGPRRSREFTDALLMHVSVPDPGAWRLIQVLEPWCPDALVPHRAGPGNDRTTVNLPKFIRQDSPRRQQQLDSSPPAAHRSIGISGDTPLRSIALFHPHNALQSCSSGSQSWRRGCRSVRTL
jgi:hypothetical protein